MGTLRSERRWVAALCVVGAIAAALIIRAGDAGAAGEVGSVRFEIVEAGTGVVLPAEIYDVAPPFQRGFFGVPAGPVVGLAVGEHTFIAVYGRYGNDTTGVMFDGANQQWGEMVTATVVDGVETLVRIEMTPPATVRFEAVSEKDGSAMSPLNVHSHPGPGPEVMHAVAGWYEIEVHSAPLVPTVWIEADSAPITHTLDPVPSGTTATLTEPLLVQVTPSLRGRVIDPTGTPLAGALVQLAPQLNNPTFLDMSPSAMTDADGNFELSARHRVWALAAFPPASRSDLAGGGTNGRGFRNSGWPDARHAVVEITLPYGRWFPLGSPRTAPTAASPVTAHVPDGHTGAGVNIVYGQTASEAGWTATGHVVETWNHRSPIIVDIHRSIAPDDAHGFALFGGGSFLTCVADRCDLARSRGPHGDQLVVEGDWSRNSWTLQASPQERGLFLDPPLAFTLSNRGITQTVDVATVDGCPAELTVGTTDWIPRAPPKPPER